MEAEQAGGPIEIPKTSLPPMVSPFCEHGIVWQANCSHCDCERIEKAIKKNSVVMDDAYWHRRWAGDAMNGLRAKDDQAHSIDIVDCAIRDADAMQKAYKERDENN